MAYENTQTRYGLYPAGEDLKQHRYKVVQIQPSANNKPEVVRGNSPAAGVLFNTPGVGQPAHIIISGIVPAQISPAVAVPVVPGDRLVADSDGTLLLGYGPFIAMEPGVAGAYIPVLLAPTDAHEELTLASDTITQDTLTLMGQELSVSLATVSSAGAMSGPDKQKLEYITVNSYKLAITVDELVSTSSITHNRLLQNLQGQGTYLMTPEFRILIGMALVLILLWNLMDLFG